MKQIKLQLLFVEWTCIISFVAIWFGVYMIGGSLLFLALPVFVIVSQYFYTRRIVSKLHRGVTREAVLQFYKLDAANRFLPKQQQVESINAQFESIVQ